jgi:hypothetical protein
MALKPFKAIPHPVGQLHVKGASGWYPSFPPPPPPGWPNAATYSEWYGGAAVLSGSNITTIPDQNGLVDLYGASTAGVGDGNPIRLNGYPTGVAWESTYTGPKGVERGMTTTYEDLPFVGVLPWCVAYVGTIVNWSAMAYCPLVGIDQQSSGNAETAGVILAGQGSGVLIAASDGANGPFGFHEVLTLDFDDRIVVLAWMDVDGSWGIRVNGQESIGVSTPLPWHGGFSDWDVGQENQAHHVEYLGFISDVPHVDDISAWEAWAG